MTQTKKTKFLIWPLLFLMAAPSYSQQAWENTRQSEVDGEITITLDEAIQLALVNNHMIRIGLLDVENAEAQIKEAWGSVYPQLSASGNYTRNLKAPNPFAGSDAGSIFETLGALDWIAFNENARTDEDPDTNPIDFAEYIERQQQGYQDAGIAPPGTGGGNPFAVENQFQFGLSLSQTIYSGAAFAAIRGAEKVRELNDIETEVNRQSVVNQIKNSFYTALLAKRQAEVLRSSVERLAETVEETKKSVQAGVLSKFDRVSAEVELVNLETDLIEVENQAELAVKNLALQLGIPTKTKVNLRGVLEYDASLQPEYFDSDLSYELASQQRPDLQQTSKQIELLEVEGEITRSSYRPTLSAFANATYIGQVPSDRTTVSPVQGEDFQFTSSERGFFSQSYWNPAVSVGLNLSWNLFNGFQTKMRVQQNKIAIRQAEINRNLQQNSIYLEIDQAVKSLETALQRIQSQERNIEQAELNYEFAVKRLKEGVGTPLQERQASSLLDQSKLNYLSAVYDYLTALSDYNRAIGKPIRIDQINND